MNSLDRLIADKKFALISIVLVFVGIFLFPAGDDSILFDLIRAFVFLIAAVLIFINPAGGYAETPAKPAEPKRREADSDPRLSAALTAEKQRPSFIKVDIDPASLKKSAQEDFDNFVKRILTVTLSALVGDSATLYFLNPAGNVYLLKSWEGNDGMDVRSEVNTGNSLLDTTLSRNLPILENDIPASSKAINYHTRPDLQVRSFLGAPVHYNDQVIGVICVDSCAAGHFSEDDKKIMTILAETISNGVRNIDRLYDVASLAQNFASIDDFNRELAASLTAESIYDSIVAKLSSYLQADRLVVATSPAEQTLVIQRVVGPIDGLYTGEPFNAGGGIAGMVMRQKKPLLIKNVENTTTGYTPRYYDEEPENSEFATFLGVPILTGDDVTGIIVLESRRSGALQDGDKEILTALTGQIALALTRAEMLDRLAKLSIRDDVTDTWNAEGFRQRLNEEKSRSHRFNQKLCLVTIEVDNYDSIRQSISPDLLKQMLKEIAEMLHERIRTVDFIARVGGGRFAMLLPSTSRFGARILAERLRASIAEKRFYLGGNVMQATVSGGIVEYPDMGEEDEELFSKIEKSIKNANSEGGNRVMIYTSKLDGDTAQEKKD